MFKRVKARLYGSKVLERLEKQLITVHGKDKGHECFGMFAITMTAAQQYEDMPKNLLDQFHAAGLSVDEVALSSLDASVTAIKRLLSETGSSLDIDAVVTNMESAIDQIFLENPGRIVPRNGRAGPAIAEFTDNT